MIGREAAPASPRPAGPMRAWCRSARAAAAAGVFVFGLVAAPTRAHHSHGNYVETFTDIEGVVKAVHLLNPHSWIYMDVKGPAGQTLTWSLEATSVVGLQRVGVTRETLRAGDVIRVRCHPLRDGSRGCLLGFVKTPDGRVTDWDGTSLPLPADF